MTTQNIYTTTIIGLGLTVVEQPEITTTFEAALEQVELYKNNIGFGESFKAEITNNGKVVYFKQWTCDSKGLDFVNLQD